MHNLQLNKLLVYNFNHNLVGVKKIIQYKDLKAILTFNNAYFFDEAFECVKLNVNPVLDVEWLQVRNIIFMWTVSNFEWYNVAQESKHSVDFPGSFSSCAWNPSQGMLALLYETGKVQIIGFDFEKSTCTTFATNNIKNQNNENSGATTTIVWDKNGDYFVTAFEKNGHIVFEVYSENCELFSVGEFDDIKLHPVLAWKPDGCIVAALQEKDNKYLIHMFENNGLKKDILPLNHISGEVKKISFDWNQTGDILAVLCATDTTSTISLYTHRNYKWDLKQHLYFENGVEIMSFNWKSSLESHIALEVLTTNHLLTYYFNWIVNATTWKENVITGTLAVIDGNTLRLTDIAEEIIPPPSSTLQKIYDNPINFVNFSPNEQFMIVITSDNTVYISDRSGDEYKIALSEILYYQNIPLSFNNFMIDNNKNLYFVMIPDNCVFRLSPSNNSSLSYNENILKICELKTPITSLSLSENVIFIVNDEDVKIYNIQTKNFETKPTIENALELYGTVNFLCSLQENNFYFDKHLIMNNVTSFLECFNFIMITTLDDKLFFYELNSQSINKLKIGSKENIYYRPIPKDAVLVTAIPNTTSIVLQLERGDLEIIKPRILSVRLVKMLLYQKNFEKAFSLVKYDRLNTDIIVDLNPEKFLEHVNDFVSSFKHCEPLNIFITGLQDDNMINKLYKNCIPNNENSSKIPKKKITVVNELIKTMLKLDHKLYLQSIITANLMLDTFEGLENAVKEIKWGILKQEKDSSFSVDDIFYRIVPMTSSEELLKAALSVQDFQLIQWIANKTQLDPLEYIPFFRELSKMEPNFKSYMINNYLKRYEVAFEHLIKCDNVENEIIQLLSKCDLYIFAFQKTSPSNKWYPIIIEKCACNLRDKKIYTEAGVLFKLIKKYTDALNCFIDGANFVEFMKLADMVKDSLPLKDYYKMLVKKLREQDRIKEAAQIYEILNLYEEGITLLIRNKYWREAMQYIHKHKRLDFIESDLYPAILDYANELCELFEKKKLEFNEHTTRLETLRSEKINMILLKQENSKLGCDNLPADFEEPDAIRNVDLDSVLSLLSVTTHQTGFTNTSSSTTKRKKKLARKTQEIRKGSVFENIAIIRQQHNIATELKRYANLVHSTCMVLMELDSKALKAAVRLHAAYADVLNCIDIAKDIIWPEDFINPPKPLTIQAAVLRFNIEHLEPQYRFPPESATSDWKIFTLT